MNRSKSKTRLHLLRTTLSLGIATTILMAIGIAITNTSLAPLDTRSVVVAVGVWTWLACVLGIAPVYFMGDNDPQQIITAYFIGMGARLLATAVCAFIAINAFNYPMEPVLIAMLWYYLPLLLLEVAMIAKHLWSTDKPTTTHSLATEATP